MHDVIEISGFPCAHKYGPPPIIPAPETYLENAICTCTAIYPPAPTPETVVFLRSTLY